MIIYEDKIYLPMIFPISIPSSDSGISSAPSYILTPIACSSPALNYTMSYMKAIMYALNDRII